MRAWVSWGFPHSWTFLRIFLTTLLSWQTPPPAPSQAPRPAPACRCSRGRVGHLARGGTAGRGASPGGCPGTGNSWGRVAGPQKASWVSGLASGSVSGLVVNSSCGSHGRNATAEVLIFSPEKETMPFSEASENHRIGTFAFFGVSFSFAITYHLLPCRQLVNI